MLELPGLLAEWTEGLAVKAHTCRKSDTNWYSSQGEPENDPVAFSWANANHEVGQTNLPTPLPLLTYRNTSAGCCTDTSLLPFPFQRWQYPHARQMLPFTFVATVTLLLHWHLTSKTFSLRICKAWIEGTLGISFSTSRVLYLFGHV